MHHRRAVERSRAQSDTERAGGAAASGGSHGPLSPRSKERQRELMLGGMHALHANKQQLVTKVVEACEVLDKLDNACHASPDKSATLTMDELVVLLDAMAFLQAAVHQHDVYRDMVDTFTAHPELFDDRFRHFFEETYMPETARRSSDPQRRVSHRGRSSMRLTRQSTLGSFSLANTMLQNTSLSAERSGTFSGGPMSPRHGGHRHGRDSIREEAAADGGSGGALSGGGSVTDDGIMSEVVFRDDAVSNAVVELSGSCSGGGGGGGSGGGGGGGGNSPRGDRKNAAKLKRVLSLGLSSTLTLPGSPRTGRNTIGENKLAMMLQGLRQWDFDVFQLCSLTTTPLEVVTGAALAQLGVCEDLRLDAAKMRSFLREIEALYAPNRYHNATHAADVTQSCLHLLTCCGLGPTLCADSAMNLALVLAASVHDVAHPGVNNKFLCRTGHELAVTYNDCSPLENMHAATAFRVMRKRNNNFFEGSLLGEDPEKLALFRSQVIAMIMMTDNDQHGSLMGELATLVAATEGSDTFMAGGMADGELHEAVLTVLQVALHAADVSNPAKPWPLYKTWTDMVISEFYEQGDRERDLGMEVSFAYDRLAPVPLPKLQQGFIKAIVLPLFQTFGDLPQMSLNHCLGHLQENLDRWHHKQLEGEAAQDGNTPTSNMTSPPSSPSHRR